MLRKHPIPTSILLSIIVLSSMVFANKTVANAQNQIHTSTISWNKYHNYTEIVNTLLELNSTYPNIVDVFPVGKSWQNRTIYCIRLTNETAKLPKPAVFFVGQHHAREPITAELALYFTVYAATNYGRNQTITDMINKSEIYIIVSLNPDGAETYTHNDWQRKNARPIDEDGDGRIDEDPPEDENGNGKIEYLWNYRYGYTVRWEGIDNDADGLSGEDWTGGVDLNRNYSYMWNASAQSGSPNPQDEDYRGPAPFSEPETKALRDIVMQHDFRYAISLHSGSDVILYPWGYTYAQTADDYKFRQLAANMSLLTGSPYEQSSLMYTTSGVWDDWMYGNQSALAFTFEIFSNDTAWTYTPGPEPYTEWVGGIGEAFNPLAPNILSTVNRWMPALLYAANKAIIEFLPGDVNHDGKVDILDVVSITSIYGSRQGDANWNPKLDLNRDGKIDILDVVIATSNYGKTAP